MGRQLKRNSKYYFIAFGSKRKLLPLINTKQKIHAQKDGTNKSNKIGSNLIPLRRDILLFCPCYQALNANGLLLQSSIPTAAYCQKMETIPDLNLKVEISSHFKIEKKFSSKFPYLFGELIQSLPLQY